MELCDKKLSKLFRKDTTMTKYILKRSYLKETIFGAVLKEYKIMQPTCFFSNKVKTSHIPLRFLFLILYWCNASLFPVKEQWSIINVNPRNEVWFCCINLGAGFTVPNKPFSSFFLSSWSNWPVSPQLGVFSICNADKMEIPERICKSSTDVIGFVAANDESDPVPSWRPCNFSRFCFPHVDIFFGSSSFSFLLCKQQEFSQQQ